MSAPLPLSAVVCVYERECYERCAKPWLSRLVEDVVEVGSSRSIFEAYNRGRQLARHREILYVHEDVRVLDEDAFRRWVGWFLETPSLQLAGVIGAKTLERVPWWQNECIGGVIQGGERTHYEFGEAVHEPRHVESLDGLFLLARMAYYWPEDAYADWHFYDAEISRAAPKGSVVVLPIPVHHVCRDKSREILPGFHMNGRIFESRHGIPFAAEKFWVTDPSAARRRQMGEAATA